MEFIVRSEGAAQYSAGIALQSKREVSQRREIFLPESNCIDCMFHRLRFSSHIIEREFYTIYDRMGKKINAKEAKV